MARVRDIGIDEVPEEIRAKAASYFKEILFETIEPYYSVVAEPGMHVLRVRLALTDLQPAPEMEEGKPGVHHGGAELEGELVDSLVRAITRFKTQMDARPADTAGSPGAGR